MKKLLTLLIIINMITNMTIASNLKNHQTDAKLNESLALAHYFKEFNKGGIPDFLSVGADGACNYSSIQTAINAYAQSPLGNVDIRIATNKTYNENIVLGHDFNISLSGGYNNCSDANAGIQSNNQSLIHGGNNGTVITIQGVTTRRTMIFSNLRLINGSNPSGAGGGLLSNNSDVALFLENVDIRNNTARNGAGIAIVGGDTDLLMRETLVFGNVADYGGGIYCSSSSAGSASSINVANHSGIIANFANSPLAVAPNGRGGGVYIDNCYFAIFTGSPNNGSFTGMNVNSSESVGGAIYAENAIIRLHGHQHCGSLGCLGDNTNPVSFRSNDSGNFGGAVLFARNSDVKMNAIWIEGNVGTSLIYTELSELIIERFLQPCWSRDKCNLIENNSGQVLNSFIVNEDISISSVNIRGNDNTVFDIFVSSTATTTPSFRVEGCMINNNGSNSINNLFDFYGPIEVDFIHTTIADNQVSQSIFRTDFNPNTTDPAALNIHSSIISNPSYDVYSYDVLDFDIGGGEMLITVSASMVNETSSISASSTLINDAANITGGTLLSTSNPLFVDRNNGNYHLSANSPAIDYFNTPSRATVLYPDIDFQTRGIDDFNTPGPFLFLYDLGADEYIFLGEDIFSNGFE